MAFRWLRTLGFMCALTLAALASIGVNAEAGPGFQVIVHSQVAGKVIERAMLADIFLGKVERWGDGRAIRMVDLSAASPVRDAFSRACLGMPTEGVRYYWLRRIATGALPPLSRKTDEDVVAYVAANRGAVGYIAEGLPLPETVKAIAIR